MSNKIEWTDWTWNPVWGCTFGCGYCYARGIANRFGGVVATQNGADYHAVKSFTPTWLPLRFAAKFPKTAKRIFVNSMSDIADWQPEWIEKVFDRIKQHPEISFQILTKRPLTLQRLEFPSNVILGVSAENNAALKVRLPFLLECHADSFFLSIEPYMSEIRLKEHTLRIVGTRSEGKIGVKKINWVICGGISGGEMPTQLAKNLEDDCDWIGIPFFFKQWGKKTDPRPILGREFYK